MGKSKQILILGAQPGPTKRFRACRLPWQQAVAVFPSHLTSAGLVRSRVALGESHWLGLAYD
jgi:hypothetical protein